MFYKIIYTVSVLGLILSVEPVNAGFGDISNTQVKDVSMREADEMEVDQFFVDKRSSAGKAQRTKNRPHPYQRPGTQQNPKDSIFVLNLTQHFQKLNLNNSPEEQRSTAGKAKRTKSRSAPYTKSLRKKTYEDKEN